MGNGIKGKKKGRQPGAERERVWSLIDSSDQASRERPKNPIGKREWEKDPNLRHRMARENWLKKLGKNPYDHRGIEGPGVEEKLDEKEMRVKGRQKDKRYKER